MGSGYSKMKKQAKLMQAQMEQYKEEMKQLEIVGSSEGSLVKITMNGEKEVKKIEIHPDCVDKDDIEGLQDLLLSAFQDATEKVEEKTPKNNNLF